MIEQHFGRGEQLLSRGRFSEAEQEFRKVVTAAPNMSTARAMLALSLGGQGKTRVDESVQEANAAIGLNPDCGFSHFVLAQCLSQKKLYRAALAACERAIRIDPEHEQYHYMRGSLLVQLNRDEEAEESLRGALAINPEDADSLSLLSIIESKAANPIGEVNAQSAVRKSPEDAMAHVAMGYSHLYQTNGRAAYDSFREALRLEPDSEIARSGMLEALRIHNFFYRQMFRFFSSMGRLSSNMQWVFIVGMLVGYQVLKGVLRHNPQLAPVLVPLLVAYFAFMLFSWLARPIGNFLLLFHQFGRIALSRNEKLSGFALVTLLTSGLITWGISTMSGYESFYSPGICMLLCAIPLCTVLLAEYDNKQSALFLRGLVAVQILLTIAATACAVTGNGSGAGVSLIGCCILCVIFMWGQNAVAIEGGREVR